MASVWNQPEEHRKDTPRKRRMERTTWFISNPISITSGCSKSWDHEKALQGQWWMTMTAQREREERRNAGN